MAVRNRSRIKVLYRLIFIDMGRLPSSLYCLKVRKGGRSFKMSGEGSSVFEVDKQLENIVPQFRFKVSGFQYQCGNVEGRNATAKRLSFSYLKCGWKIGNIKEEIFFRSHPPSLVHQ